MCQCGFCLLTGTRRRYRSLKSRLSLRLLRFFTRCTTYTKTTCCLRTSTQTGRLSQLYSSTDTSAHHQCSRLVVEICALLNSSYTRLYFLKTEKHGLDHQNLLHFTYLTVICPVLEYGSVVWHHSLSKTQCESLEAIQRRLEPSVLSILLPLSCHTFSLWAMLKSHLFTLVMKKLINVFQDYLSPFLLHFSLFPHKEMAILLDQDLQQYIIGKLPEQNVFTSSVRITSPLESTSFFIPSTSLCLLSSWFTSSYAYHLITVITFVLTICHALHLSLQT